jgi:DNA-damage-inducible protein D
VAIPHQTITEKLDAIKRLTAKGVEYWEARELMPLLGYKRWESFRDLIGRAMVAFDSAGEHSSHHFRESTKVMEVGKGAKMEVEDFYLSRPACYIIVMNGDSTKEEIAEGQKYFAIQTRRMEKVDRLAADLKRVALRNRLKDHNTKLNGTAQMAGVKRYGLFHAAGIQAMYQMRLTDLKGRRGIGENEDWLDRQGTEELAANDFRITQADAKIKREGIHGEQAAINAHAAVGREVRVAIKRMGNRMPEDLPQEVPIKEIERRLSQKKIAGPASA